MKIYCISEGALYRADGAQPQRIECGRIRDYLKAVNDMKKRDEWKTTGKGAAFMNVEAQEYDTAGVFLRSIGSDGTRLIYSTYIDGVGGLYFKDTDSGDETYIYANRSDDPGRMSFYGGKCCIDLGEGEYERHIAMLDPDSGGVDTITEGFTSESCPFISRSAPERIYYSAVGYAQNEYGAVLDKSPSSICMYDASSGQLSDVLTSGEYDYLKPADDKDGNLYCIRRKYEPARRNTNLGEDILMFPYRIVKAVGGLFNYFSMRYGGEPLRTGGNNPARSRTADEREMFVEGNLIKARRKAESGNTDEGIIPSEWVLIKRSPSGGEEVLLRGVMDYCLLDDGRIVYSDGSSVKLRDTSGKTERICKLPLANCITVIPD